jgi:hypothetical protein
LEQIEFTAGRFMKTPRQQASRGRFGGALLQPLVKTASRD